MLREHTPWLIHHQLRCIVSIEPLLSFWKSVSGVFVTGWPGNLGYSLWLFRPAALRHLCIVQIYGYLMFCVSVILGNLYLATPSTRWWSNCAYHCTNSRIGCANTTRSKQIWSKFKNQKYLRLWRCSQIQSDYGAASRSWNLYLVRKIAYILLRWCSHNALFVLVHLGVWLTCSVKEKRIFVELRIWCWTKPTECLIWDSSLNFVKLYLKSDQTGKLSCGLQRGQKRSYRSLMISWPITSK